MGLTNVAALDPYRVVIQANHECGLPMTFHPIYSWVGGHPTYNYDCGEPIRGRYVTVQSIKTEPLQWDMVEILIYHGGFKELFDTVALHSSKTN